MLSAAILKQVKLPVEFQQGPCGLLGPLWQEQFLPPLPLIFIDGGARFKHLPYLSLAPQDRPYPQYCLGDGDTYPEGYANFELQLKAEKDLSDFAAALAILPPAPRQIYLYGLSGGKRDHEWAVLGEIDAFLSTHPQQQICDADYTAFAAGTYHFDFKGRFSLLSLQANQITLTGQIKYPLMAPTTIAPLSSRGLSNEAHGPWQICATKPFVIFQQGLARWPR